MMVSITHFLKSFRRLKPLCVSGLTRGRMLCVHLLGALVLTCLSVAHADTPVALQELKVARQDGALYLSADWQFELPSALEDALTKGITLYFVTEVDVRQERWYFYNQRVAHAERHVRLFYQPLTRRWRVNVSPQPFSANGLGMSLGQSYDTVVEAMDAVRRITPWRIANVSDVSLDAKPSISLSFKLDLTQLPRPLQMGATVHSDWTISFNKTQRLELAP
jgi:hypothetical protein